MTTTEQVWDRLDLSQLLDFPMPPKEHRIIRVAPEDFWSVIRPARRSPVGLVIDKPVEQGFFKAYIMSHSFALDPLMTEYFVTLGQKLLIERCHVEHILVSLWR